MLKLYCVKVCWTVNFVCNVRWIWNKLDRREQHNCQCLSTLPFGLNWISVLLSRRVLSFRFVFFCFRKTSVLRRDPLKAEEWDGIFGSVRFCTKKEIQLFVGFLSNAFVAVVVVVVVKRFNGKSHLHFPRCWCNQSSWLMC